jgi:hypothetical protein
MTQICCYLSSDLVANAGEAGLSLVAVSLSPSLSGFLLQARAVAYGTSLQRWDSQGEAGLKLRVLHSVGVKFCPSCGLPFSSWIDAHPREFARLAEEHRRFAEMQ